MKKNYLKPISLIFLISFSLNFTAEARRVRDLERIPFLEFGGITPAISLGFAWPEKTKIDTLSLSQETKNLLLLPYYVDTILLENIKIPLQLLYPLGYLNTLSSAKRKVVFDEIRLNLGYELADFFEENFKKTLSDISLWDAIKEKSGLTYIDIERIKNFVSLRDYVIKMARGVKIGVEILQINEVQVPNDIFDTILNNKPIRDVLFGLREASVLSSIDEETIEQIKPILWTIRQVEGIAIQIMRLPDGRYYIYNEYALRWKALENNLNLAVTKQGLEHLIKMDMTRGNGLFYQLAAQDIKVEDALASSLEVLIGNVLRGSIGGNFISFDKDNFIYKAGSLSTKVFELGYRFPGYIFIATIDRPEALRKELEAEIQNFRIFNRSVPTIVVIDDSSIKDPEKTNLRENTDTIKKLSETYGVSIFHINNQDKLNYQRNISNNLVELFNKQWRDLDSRVKKILEENGILKDGKIDSDAMNKYINGNVFRHISGIRNVTVLMGKGDSVLVNVDDDAPPETYTPFLGEIDRIRNERENARSELFAQFMEEIGRTVSRPISTEEELYQVLVENEDNSQINQIIRKYFAYSEDGKTGLIPQAMAEIVPLSGVYIEPSLRLTHQRYQSLMEPLPEYLIAISDFIYPRPRMEKEENKYMILPVDVYSLIPMIGGKAQGFPFILRDLRGTMGIPLTGLGLEALRDRIIHYIPFPFVVDQDTSGFAQFIRYLEGKDKLSKHLQHTDQTALIVEGVGGFIANTYVIFNRAFLDNRLPTPSIGRDLRLEEPPYLKWIRVPVMLGQAIVFYSPIGGGQQRSIEERAYLISSQDFNEVAGGIARRGYEEALIRFYGTIEDSHMSDDAIMKRMQDLGEMFVKVGETFSLEEEEIKALLLGREVRTKLLIELGIQRAERAISTDNPQEIRDMDFTLVGYACDFSLYHSQGKNYEPKDSSQDYFYKIKIDDDGFLHITKVVPYLKVEDIGGVPQCTHSEWKELDTEEIVIEKFPVNEFFEIENGRSIILTEEQVKRIRKIESGIVIPSVVDDFQNDHIERITNKIKDQIKKDGELLILWPYIVDVASHWRDFFRRP